MGKLAWYVVIMVAIDVLLCLARFCEKAAKSARKGDGPPAGSPPQEATPTSGSDNGSSDSPSA